MIRKKFFYIPLFVSFILLFVLAIPQSGNHSSTDILTVYQNGDFNSLLTANAEIRENSVPIQSIMFNKNKVVLGVRETFRIKTLIDPKNTTESYTFHSSDESVASVSERGEITALKPGTAIIRMKSASGVSEKCKVFVKKAPTLLTLKETKLTLAKGKTIKLKAILQKEETGSIAWFSMDKKVATVNANGIVTAKKDGTTTIIATTYNGAMAECELTVGEPAATVSPIKSNGKQIALTFDDGPGKFTEKLLDALKKMDVKATFFVLGSNVPYYPKALQRMEKEGHEIGSHAYSHKQLTNLSTASIESEINKTKEAVQKACGVYPTLFRPPYGSYNDTVLAKAGVPVIFWSVDTLDWKHRDNNYVKKTILQTAKDGAIVLLHDIHETTVDGAIKAIRELKKQGYEFLTVTQLLTRDGVPLNKGQRYSSAPAAK